MYLKKVVVQPPLQNNPCGMPVVSSTTKRVTRGKRKILKNPLDRNLSGLGHAHFHHDVLGQKYLNAFIQDGTPEGVI